MYSSYYVINIKEHKIMHHHIYLAGGRWRRLDVLLGASPVLPLDAVLLEAYGRIIAQCGWLKGDWNG
jgi:hypothetical protein